MKKALPIKKALPAKKVPDAKKALPALALAALALLTPSGAGRAGAQGQARKARPITVAVVRPGGVIVPFAQFKDGRWSNPWPKGADEPASEDRALSDAPEGWFSPGGAHAPLWHYRSQTSGGGRAVLRASARVKVDNHCQTNWGLATDYPRAESEKDCHGSVGVALDSAREIGPALKLDKSGGEWPALAAFVKGRFEQAEARAADAAPEYVRAASLPARGERVKIDPTVTDITCHEFGGGRRLCSFAAERKYAKPPSARDAGCENISYLDGWLLQTGGGRPLLVEQGLALSDCDGKEVSRVRPLGSLSIGGRDFFVVEEHGYESESYVIYELEGRKIRRLLLTYAGAC